MIHIRHAGSVLAVAILAAGSLRAEPSREGKRLYLTYCVACHGTDGRGRGEVASRLPVPPADLTRPGFLVKMSDADLRRAIAGRGGVFHGSRYLPSMKVRFTTEQIYQLISYLRTFQPVPQGDPIEGRKLYVAYCSPCHGRNGKGDGEKVPYLDAKPHDQSDDRYMSARTDEDLFRAIRFGGSAVHGAKFMPSWRETLRPSQIWDIVSYIRMLHRTRRKRGVVARGRQLFLTYCASCHGEEAEGDGPMADILTPRPRSLHRSSLGKGVTELDLYFTILGGGKAMNLSEQMPSWGDVLTESDVWDLVRYLRSLP